MVMELKKRADTQFYRLGKFIWIPVYILGKVFTFYFYPKYVADNPSFECFFKKATGLPCPGCGGTRAVVLLFSRDIIRSFCYNPTVLYCVGAYIEFMALYFTRKHITKTILYKPIRISIYLYVLVGVIIFQWIVKLILVFVLLR